MNCRRYGKTRFRFTTGMPKLFPIRVLLVLALFLASFAHAQVSMVPDSLSSAQDIVEVRLWLRQLWERMRRYDPPNGPTKIGAWPNSADFNAVLTLGNEIAASENVDWTTLSLITDILIVRTPQDEAVVQLSDKIVGATLPPEVRQQELSTIARAMWAIARQGDQVSIPLFLKYERPDFWAGRSRRMVIPSSSNPTGEADAHLRLREAAVRSLAAHVEIERAVVELDELEKLRVHEPAMLSHIQGMQRVIQQRRNPKGQNTNNGLVE